MIKPAVSVMEYLTTSYSPDVDYVDGDIEERNLGEYNHARLQGRLIMILGAMEKRLGIQVLPEVRMRVSPTRYRVPDVVVMGPGFKEEPIITEPPLLVIEILSPEDRWHRFDARLKDYIKFGVPHIWVIDPVERKAWYLNGKRKDEVDVLEVDGWFSIPLKEVFD